MRNEGQEGTVHGELEERRSDHTGDKAERETDHEAMLEQDP